MKLYKRFNRLAYLRMVPKPFQKRILWALSLKPGDLVNDCSMFNVAVRKVEPDIWLSKRGWFIHDVEFCVEPFGGFCSLLQCGVEPALSAEQVEQKLRHFYSEYEAHGGWETKTEKDPVWMRLSKGLPICDDRGVKL